MIGIKLRMTRGRTWANCTEDDFLTPAFMKRIGRLLLKSVIFEARKDLAKQGGRRTPTGEPEGIPDDEAFFKSFSFKIKGKTVEIHSSWPQIEQITEGRRPYPMDWLTQQAGISRFPMKGEDGTVLIRTTPTTSDDAWVHPGFRKNNFIRRGYERGRREMDQKLQEHVMKTLQGMPIA